MITKLDDHQITALDEVNHAVLFGDPARPSALQHVLERLRFSEALIGVAEGILDQLIDALEDCPVLSQPPLVFTPGMSRERQSHDANFRTLVFLFLDWASDASRRLALAGERNR